MPHAKLFHIVAVTQTKEALHDRIVSGNSTKYYCHSAFFFNFPQAALSFRKDNRVPYATLRIIHDACAGTSLWIHDKRLLTWL
jgi:hypothetical protein